jgi:hypothetical protein
MELKNLKMKINRTLRGHVPGSVITVYADKNNVLVDSFWRRRLEDARVSKNEIPCVEIIEEVQEKIAKKSEVKNEINKEGKGVS